MQAEHDSVKADLDAKTRENYSLEVQNTKLTTMIKQLQDQTIDAEENY